jgi:hypothetical protein
MIECEEINIIRPLGRQVTCTGATAAELSQYHASDWGFATGTVFSTGAGSTSAGEALRSCNC